MIKYLRKKITLGFLGLAIGMALIGMPNDANAGGCCATDSPGPACGGCCQKKWQGPSQAKRLKECQENCQKGNCRKSGAGGNKNTGNKNK